MVDNKYPNRGEVKEQLCAQTYGDNMPCPYVLVFVNQ